MAAPMSTTAEDSETDSEEEDVHYAGMIQPPLIQQLRNILAEYPDGGQILKEIIQNAEDAGAQVMKIMHDTRPIMDDNVPISKKKTPFRSYFKGPSLCIFNDALFDEKDWSGITMLYNSIKEFDPLKVGRFGLGFKSVFHITEYPMIVSGSKLLIIDPNMDSSKVCQSIKLKTIGKGKSKKMICIKEDILKAFDGLYGFDEKTLEQGVFSGTILRMPLRQGKTALSDISYDQEKANELLESFKDEAPFCLLFLKSLLRIDIVKGPPLEQDVENLNQVEFSVYVEDPTDGKIHQRKKEFIQQIKEINQTNSQKTLQNSYKTTLCTTYEKGPPQKCTWMVTNGYKGADTSDEMQRLTADESLSYSPYVGAAVPLPPSVIEFGHVFCFLPLPFQQQSLSGLPVHINGFLALSQNRRHVKWPTVDQVRHSTHQDKTIRWNECLVKEAMSETYFNLIRCLIDESQSNNNPADLVNLVYTAIPNQKMVTENWDIILEPFLNFLKEDVFLFTQNNGGHWIRISEVVLTNNVPLEHKECVKEILGKYNKNWAEIPQHVLDVCKTLHPDVDMASAEYISSLLKECTTYDYKLCSKPMKLSLLSYLLHADPLLLDGLQLIPLDDSSFTEFKQYHHKHLYFCTQQEKRILPGLNDIIISDIPESMRICFGQIAKQEIFQVRFPEQYMVELLELVVERNFNSKSKSIVRSNFKVEMMPKWQEHVWKYILQCPTYTLESFKHLPLVPLTFSNREENVIRFLSLAIQQQLTVGKGKNDMIVWFPVESMLILEKGDTFVLPKEVARCLETMFIFRVKELPEFITACSDFRRYILSPSPDNIVHLLSRIQSDQMSSVALSFNTNTLTEERDKFLSYLGNVHELHNNTSKLLKMLKIFPSDSQEGNEYLEIEKCNRILLQELPVKCPRPMLRCKDNKTRLFAQNLEAVVMSEMNVLQEIFERCQDSSLYTVTEKTNILVYFMNNFAKYENEQRLIHTASQITCIPTMAGSMRRPRDLFNSTDQILYDLFDNENLFPAKRFETSYKKPLIAMGMKGIEECNEDDILGVAKDLHNISTDIKDISLRNFQRKEKQSEALCKILANYTDKFCTVFDKIRNLRVVFPQSRPDEYLHALPWFGDSQRNMCKPADLYHWQFSNFVGSVALIFKESVTEKLAKFFGSRFPLVDDVLAQLDKLSLAYSEDLRAQYLPIISQVSIFLACNYKHTEITKIKADALKVWNGNGFSYANSIYCESSKNDINLEPYIFHLPPELRLTKLHLFWRGVGCHENQNRDILLFVQHQIKEKYDSQVQFEEGEVKRDLDLIIQILGRLKLDISELKDSGLEVLFPIHTNDEKYLKLMPGKNCNFCNSEWLRHEAIEEGESFHFVHSNVPLDTAEKLGVPSLTDDLLVDTEGIEGWGQSEPLTRRIHNLIEEYKDGFSIPKEIVQNADDAGASTVCFLYDERENIDFRCRLIDEEMAECQGPALWAYNNSLFTEKDIKNITQLSGATKVEDASTIGKFGLGFCSVYNLTDVPSFVSGSNMVIFDPHTTYLGKAIRGGEPGLKIDFKKTRNKVMMRRMKNQFQPFIGVFGCDLSMTGEDVFYNGTLFRFPLRTEKQADSSSISAKAYHKSEMEHLIDIFAKNAGNLLLFTQNVEAIEFYHLNKKANSPTEKTLLYRVNRTRLKTVIGKEMDQSPLRRMTQIMKDKRRGVDTDENIEYVSLCKLSVEVAQSRSSTEKQTSVSHWLISWASGKSSCMQMAKESIMKGSLPLGAVAALLLDKEMNGNFHLMDLKSAPFGFYKESHIFCYLPMPITTQMPLHLNGSFAVTSDRKQLASKTEDDKFDGFEPQWNEVMFSDTLTNAYLQLLKSIRFLNIQQTEYYTLWPTESKSSSLVESLHASFYRIVCKVQKHAIFCVENKWMSFEDCVFIDPELLASDIGGCVYEACTYFRDSESLYPVSVPCQILHNIRTAVTASEMRNKVITVQDFFTNFFFPNILNEFWKSEERNKIALYALDNHFDELEAHLGATSFIPSMPNGTLKSPSQIVNRRGDIAKLFSNEDERFIDPKAERHFMESHRMSKLEKLGLLKDEIPAELLIERVQTVEKISFTCRLCAFDRCLLVMKFIQRCQEKTIFSRLANIRFLPVLMRPTDWTYTWFAECLSEYKPRDAYLQFECHHQQVVHEKCCQVFESPNALYALHCQNLVSTIHCILDEQALHYPRFDTLKKLGIHSKSDICYEPVNHLLQLSRDVISQMNDKQNSVLIQEVCNEIYSYLDSHLRSNDDYASDRMEELKKSQCLFVDGKFWYPSQIAVSCKVDCSPILIGLNTSTLRYREALLSFLRISPQFSVDVVISALIKLEHDMPVKSEIPTESKNIIIHLIQLLAERMRDERVEKEYLNGKDILVPDEHGMLRSIKDLCIDDMQQIKKLKKMTYIDKQLSRLDAETIGVKSKVRGALSQYSRGFKPFGQKEELKTRIKRILSGYQCDIGILKELLQNADDARAKEVKIILDFNYHKSEKVFEKSWKPLQGPALLVYNDACFSNDDLIGIQQLGIGSKGDDPTKTGQYGVGFNAVYHLTDVPSFLTKGDKVENGETLCVMDPHCKYVPNATPQDPGMQYLDLPDLRESFPDVFTVYYENLLPGNCFTIFRFPLRTIEFASCSSLSQTQITETFIRNLLQDFKKEMSESLLFLSSVKKVSICEVKEGNLKEMYQSEMILSDENELKRSNYIRESANAIRTNGNDKCFKRMPVIDGVYEGTLREKNIKETQWLICQRTGFTNTDFPERLHAALTEGKIGMLPRGGVALNMGSKPLIESKPSLVHTETLACKAFCFLPLPIITGLPVHVNGHFALDHEARRNLWTDDKLGYRSEWNEHMIKFIVAPAYVKAVLQWKDCNDLKSGSKIEKRKIKRKLQLYHASFPVHSEVNGKIWKELVSAFYKMVDKNESLVFLSCRLTTKVEVSCFSTKCKGCFPIVFNFLQKQLERENETKEEINKEAVVIEKIAKDMNMKLVDTPYWIFESLKQSGINLTKTSPDLFIDFFKSYNNNSEGNCSITGIGRNVSNTKFKKLEDLVTVLKYCMCSENFAKKMNGLPLCVTEDLCLRDFTDQRPVLLSTYSGLFRNSTQRFVKQSLAFHLKHIEDKVSCLKQLSLHELPSLLEENIDKDHSVAISKTWNPESVTIPNYTWIDTFWRMVYDWKKENGDSVEGIEKLKDWHLVPTKHNEQQLLYVLQRSKEVVDISSFDGKLKKAIVAMDLPTLDVRTENKLLSSLVTSYNRSTYFLQFLYSHRQFLEEKEKKKEHCEEILVYLAERLDAILENFDKTQCFKMIRSLPLVFAVHGGNISIPESRKIFVLPPGIPSSGIEQWARNTDTTLLEQNQRLHPLYCSLEISPSSLLDVYVNQIFPTWHILPEEAWIHHLLYIKDSLLQSQLSYKANNDRLVNALKRLAFIKTGSECPKSAGEYYNKENEIFKHLCFESEFPPEPFCKHSWNHFMVISGIKNVVDPQLFLKFAKRIQASAGNMKDIETKSRCLVAYLFRTKSLHNDSLLEQVRTIKFIVPYKVSQSLINIHKQYEADSLIAFHGSSFKCHANILWSNTPLLPGWATPTMSGKEGESMRKKLGIRNPELHVVVQHVKNICSSLSSKLERSGIDCKSVHSTIVENYTFLKEHGMKSANKTTLRELKDVPIVFLTSDRIMVTCDKIVIGLRGKHEIKGYLMPSPEEYGAYNALFEFLGTKRDGTCSIFARALSSIKAKVKEDILHPNEREAVTKATHLFFESLPDEEKVIDQELDGESLYLLATDITLQNAKRLVYIDNKLFTNKMKETNFKFIRNLSNIDFDVMLKRLPNRCRPKFLTDMYTKNVKISYDDVVPCDEEKMLNDFLQSEFFVMSVLRLISYEISFNPTQSALTAEEKKTIATNLKMIKFRQVSKIEQTYSINNEVIMTEVKDSHYTKGTSNGRNVFEILFVYTQSPENFEKFVVKLDDSFSSAVRSCSGRPFDKSSKHLMKMLMYYDTPDNIESMLDESKIPHLHKAEGTDSFIPTVGDYVQPDLHHLLDDGFCVFYEGEFVAVLIHDNNESTHENNELGERVFVYAKIIGRVEIDEKEFIGVFQKYKIRIHKSKEEIEIAYKLYKFTRDMINRFHCEKHLVLYERHTDNDECPSSSGAEPGDMDGRRSSEDRQDNRTLKEIFKEVRDELKAIWSRLESAERNTVCKRLLRKWHPDKNYGNEKKAEEVFKYIKQIIRLLEHGKRIPDDDDVSSSTSDSYFDTSDWFNEDFFENIFRNCRRERERWENFTRNRHSRSRHDRSSTFNEFFRRHREYEPNPQPFVARQWLRQAQKDATMAKDTFDIARSESAFNWTCFMCHQAIEKALKAVQYNKDAKKVFDGDSLRHNASNLGRELESKARQFEDLIGTSKRMRYPTVSDIDMLPSDLFSGEDATKALRLTTEILSFVTPMVI